MKKREFCMLASPMSEEYNLSQWLMSEKLDGVRCLWIPSTRGIPKRDLSFANHIGDERFITKPISTGCWSRYGNVIHVPDFILDQLPEYPLDMEIWLGRKKFQEMMGFIKDITPNSNLESWKKAKLMVLDAPTHEQIFAIGRINNPNFTKEMTIADRIQGKDFSDSSYFELRYNALYKNFKRTENVVLHDQMRLSYLPEQAKKAVTEKLLEVSKGGGEGLIVKAGYSPWEPCRSKLMLKIKPAHDDEAEVIGYIPGEKRLVGMLGSLLVKWKGKEFKLSGMTDLERVIYHDENDQIRSNVFPIGTIVTFTYRELSDEGIPKEARYFRKKVD